MLEVPELVIVVFENRRSATLMFETLAPVTVVLETL